MTQTERPVVVAGVIKQWPDGRWKFPTIAGCFVCGGLTYIVRGYGQPVSFEPDEATRIALIQHGYYLGKWEGHNVANARSVPYGCRCGHLHDWEAGPPSYPAMLHCRVCDRLESRRDSSG